MQLTTEHAASSYGIPVLVDALGNAYGPADVVPDDGKSGLYIAPGTTARQIVNGNRGLPGFEDPELVRAFLGE